jgi:hypothetical protein
MAIGSKTQVWRGSKDTTPGGLRKADLTKNKYGKVVSRKASVTAKRKNNLGAYQSSKAKKAPPKKKKPRKKKPKKPVQKTKLTSFFKKKSN